MALGHTTKSNEKSKQDWDEFKKSENIEEDLASFPQQAKKTIFLLRQRILMKQRLTSGGTSLLIRK